ncbi:prephenate dehydrogenase [Fulvivirga sedimenti]|uniref:Prephenate dehydrogenase n=1 Tax=Fulvivirga sedimenti TaxID=2879465 RepID=A0A9X1HX98_9BACT|nr:prephenate dehydrogenase [Fulvivirga sedimenti]MCA6079045.1 prephenate dehydrogenase [Fulvivirga sedimenti]
MKIGVIGCGLIGGSMVMDLKAKGWTDRVYGVDANERHADSARAYGFIDEVTDLDHIAELTDVILLAIPVQAIQTVLPVLLDQLNDEQVVIDMGSTKAAICEHIKTHPRRKQYVAAHPIAGTENTGPSAAHEGLFKDKVNIICDRERTGAHAMDVAASMFRALGMKTVFMDAAEHDRHIAYVSHLSHISSFMLGHTVLEIEKDEKSIFNMAGSGFQSTVRLAMSSPDMWTPIFMQNAQNVTNALDEYIDHLVQFRKLLNEGDREGLQELLLRANQIRRILKK